MESENTFQTVRDTSALCMDSFMPTREAAESAMNFLLDGVNEHLKGVFRERDVDGSKPTFIELRFNVLRPPFSSNSMIHEGFITIRTSFEKETKAPTP